MAALAQISFITGIMCANLSAKDQRQGLLCLILTFAPQDHRRKTPNCGHCASDAGAISVGVVVSLEESFVGGRAHRYSRLNFKRHRIAAFAEWRQLLSA